MFATVAIAFGLLASQALAQKAKSTTKPAETTTEPAKLATTAGSAKGELVECGANIARYQDGLQNRDCPMPVPDFAATEKPN